jgi:hypothetical protein
MKTRTKDIKQGAFSPYLGMHVIMKDICLRRKIDERDP